MQASPKQPTGNPLDHKSSQSPRVLGLLIRYCHRNLFLRGLGQSNHPSTNLRTLSHRDLIKHLRHLPCPPLQRRRLYLHHLLFTPLPIGGLQYFHCVGNKMGYKMVMYVDGGCRGNGFPGAFGACACYVVRKSGRGKTFTRHLPAWMSPVPTSQRAELYAIILALEHAVEE